MESGGGRVSNSSSNLPTRNMFSKDVACKKHKFDMPAPSTPYETAAANVYSELSTEFRAAIVMWAAFGFPKQGGS